MIIRYLDPLEKLKYEIKQRREEGNQAQAKALERAFRELPDGPDEITRKSARNLLADLMKEDIRKPNISPDEPDDLNTIRQLAPCNRLSNQQHPNLNEADLYNRLLGGWLGRAAGCLLGKPVERYMRPDLKKMLKSSGNWPLNNYWTQQGMPRDILDKYPWKRRFGKESLRENIECMPEDDDLNYPMLNLHIMETCGFNFNSRDVGTAWLTNMPVFQVFTAERVAYFNFLEGRNAPESATYMNPFREWIGAQIRADLWGYVSPGNALQAAEMAWRDARISHTRNGIYGEMFFAALIADAFIESDPRKLVGNALTQIPKNSRFSKAIEIVLDLPINTTGWEAILDKLQDHFGDYHWVHTLNNAALTVAALLAGDGDYEKTICNTVMGGWDTDSNGATAGSIIGIIQGAEALPAKWISPLNNRIRSSLNGFDNTHFTDLAQRTLAVIQQPVDQNSTSLADLSGDF